MKLKIVFLLFVSILLGKVNSQSNYPNGLSSTFTATPIIPTGYNVDVRTNSARTKTAIAPFDDINVFNQQDYTKVKESVQFYDGFGRLLQTVGRQFSPNNAKDIVQPFLYDAFGREAYTFMPYVSSSNDGHLRTDPFTEQNASLSLIYNPNNSGEKFFFGKTEFEASLDNRVEKTFAQGNSWVGSNRGKVFKYELNISNEVVLWDISAAAGSLPQSVGYYNSGQLKKNITTDEGGHSSIEYIDNNNHVLLKKKQVDPTAVSTSPSGWLCTYYIYDDMQHLRFILTPNAIAAGPMSQSVADEYCFRYEYDEFNRQIIKKVPGSGEEHFVYDENNRLVMQQDAQLRNSGQWMVTQYDNLNRPVSKLLWNNTGARSIHQSNANGQVDYPSPTALVGAELLTKNFYDDYTWVPTGFNGISASLNTMYTSSTDYISSINTSPLYAQAIAQSKTVYGKATGSMTKILGTNNYLYTVTFYDDNGRIIQSVSTNKTEGFNIATMQYDFSGRVLQTHLYHQNPLATPTDYIILSRASYDYAGNIVKVEKKINGGNFIPISEKKYTEFGQLETKKIGQDPVNTSQPLHISDYSYNIRGWLNDINKNYVENPNDGSKTRWFGMELMYDCGFTENQYNGNVAGTLWKSKGSSDRQRAYGYGYDYANRLLKADFSENIGSWGQYGINYDVKMGNDGADYISAYDENSNIKRMQQSGLYLGGSGPVDDLQYNYYPNSNKLQNVVDIVNDPLTKLEDFKSSTEYMTSLGGTKTSGATDYDYDVNGNLLYDNNKDIQTITYNFLNLPVEITMTKGRGTITFTYDANGNMLRKVIADNTINPAKTTTIDYVQGFIYENNLFQYTNHEEGRIRALRDNNNNIIGYPFDYFIKDYLGNVRAVLTDEQKIDVYQAGFEDANAAFEGQIFLNYTNIIPKPGCFDANGDKVHIIGCSSKTGGAKAIIGTGKVLKVMAGDHVNARVRGWFSTSITNDLDPSSLTPLSDLIPALFSGGIVGTGGEPGGFTSGSSSLLSNGVAEFLKTQEGIYYDEGAYLNWILLDEEQFKLVNNSSGFESLVKQLDGGSSSCGPTAVLQANGEYGIDIARNGYLYIYLSNTNKDYPVYFDELHIEHVRGPLLEENAYYPFGLIMSNISSKAVNTAVNKYKYNNKEQHSKEFTDGAGLDWYSYGKREYDNQIGRFFRVDPLASDFPNLTPYQYASNDPTGDIDVDGCESLSSFFETVVNAAGLSNYNRPGGGTAFTKDVSIEFSKSYYQYIIKPAVTIYLSEAIPAFMAMKWLKGGGTGVSMSSTAIGSSAITSEEAAIVMRANKPSMEAVAALRAERGAVQSAIEAKNLLIAKSQANILAIQAQAAKNMVTLGEETAATVATFRNSTAEAIEATAIGNESKTVGLGIDADLAFHRGTEAITYKRAGWQQAGLTKVDWGRASDPYYFEQSFKEVAQSAGAIRFNVSNFDPFYPKPGVTNFEFNYIVNNPSLLQKTTFIQNGNPVFWNGSGFIR